MIAWLTRQRNNLFMLTKHRPVIEEVGNSGEKDAYVVPGDPVGARNLCKLFFGEIELSPLESKRINITVKEVK